MEEVRNALIEEFRRGNYTPLIFDVIKEKCSNQENFTWLEIYTLIQKITETKHNPDVAQELKKCINAAVKRRLYFEVGGVYIPVKR